MGMKTSIAIRTDSKQVFKAFKEWCTKNDTSVSGEFDKMMRARVYDMDDNSNLVQKIIDIKLEQQKLDDRIAALNAPTAEEVNYIVGNVPYTERELLSAGWTPEAIGELPHA